MALPRDERVTPTPPKKPRPPRTTSYADDRRTPTPAPSVPSSSEMYEARWGTPRPPTVSPRRSLAPPPPPLRVSSRFDRETARTAIPPPPKLPDLSRAVQKPNPLTSGGAFEHRTPDVVLDAAEATNPEPIRSRVVRPKTAPRSFLERNPGIAYQLQRTLAGGDQDAIGYLLSDILGAKFEDENQRLFDRLGRRKTKMEGWYSQAEMAAANGDLTWAERNPMPKQWQKMPSMDGNKSPESLQEEYIQRMEAAQTDDQRAALERYYFGNPPYDKGAIQYAQERQKTLGYQDTFLKDSSSNFETQQTEARFWDAKKNPENYNAQSVMQFITGAPLGSDAEMEERLTNRMDKRKAKAAAAAPQVYGEEVAPVGEPVSADTGEPSEDYEKTLEEANPSVWDRFADIGKEVVSLGSYDDASDSMFEGEVNTFGLGSDEPEEKAVEDTVRHVSDDAPAGDPVEAEEGHDATSGIGGPPSPAMAGPLGLPANIWGAMNKAVDEAVQQPLAHKMEPVADGLWYTIDKISRPIYADNAAVKAWYMMDKEAGKNSLDTRAGVNWLNPLDVVSRVYGKDITDPVDDVTMSGLGNVAEAWGGGFTDGGWGGNAKHPVLGHEIVHYNAEHDGAENMYDKGWVQQVYGLTGDVLFDPVNFLGIGAPLKAAKEGLAVQRAAEEYTARSAKLYDEIMTQEEVLTQAGLDPKEVYTALMGTPGRRPWTAKGKARFQRDVETGTVHVEQMLRKAENELLAAGPSKQAESRAIGQTIENLKARRDAVRTHYNTNAAVDIVNSDPTRVKMRTDSGTQIYRSTELAENITEANDNLAYLTRVAREMGARMPEAYKGYGGQGSHNPNISQAANEAQAQGDALSHVLDAKSNTVRENTDVGVERRAMEEQDKTQARVEGYSRPGAEKSAYELKLEAEYDKAVAEGDLEAVSEIGKKLDSIDAGGAGIYSYAEVTRQLDEITARGNPREIAAFEARLNAAHAKVDSMQGYKEGRDAEGILPHDVRSDPRLTQYDIRKAHRDSLAYVRKQPGGGPRAKAIALHNKITRLRKDIAENGSNFYKERRLRALETKYKYADRTAKRQQAAYMLERLKQTALKTEAKEKGLAYVNDRERYAALGNIVKEAKRRKGITPKIADEAEDAADTAAREAAAKQAQERTVAYNEALAKNMGYDNHAAMIAEHNRLAKAHEKMQALVKPAGASWKAFKDEKDRVAAELTKFENVMEASRKNLEDTGEWADQYSGTGLAPETSMAGEAVAKVEKRTSDRPEEGDYTATDDLLNADNTPVEGLFEGKRGPFSYHSQLDEIIREAEKQQKELGKRFNEADMMHDDETIKYLAPLFKDVNGNLDRAKFDEFFEFDSYGKIFQVKETKTPRDPDLQAGLERIAASLDERFQKHYEDAKRSFNDRHYAAAETEWERLWLNENQDHGTVQDILSKFGDPGKDRQYLDPDKTDVHFDQLRPYVQDPETGKPLFLGSNQDKERILELVDKAPKKSKLGKAKQAAVARLKDLDGLKDLYRSKSFRKAMGEKAFVHGKTKSSDYSRKEMNSLLDEIYKNRGKPPIANPRDLFNHTIERYPDEVQAWAERHLGEKAQKLEERLGINDIAAINRVRAELAEANVHLPADNYDALQELVKNANAYELQLSSHYVGGRRLFEQEQGMSIVEAENMRQRAMGNVVEMDAGPWAGTHPEGVTMNEFIDAAVKDFDSFRTMMYKSRFHMERLTKVGEATARKRAGDGIAREDYATAADWKRAIAHAEDAASKQWMHENWDNLLKRPLSERKQILKDVFRSTLKHTKKNVDDEKKAFIKRQAAEYKKAETLPWNQITKDAEKAAEADLGHAIMRGTLGEKHDLMGLREYHSEFRPVADVEEPVMSGDDIIRANYEEKQARLQEKREEIESQVVPEADKRDLNATIKDLENQQKQIRKEYDDQMDAIKKAQAVFDTRMAEEAILRAGSVPLVQTNRVLQAQFFGKGVAIPGSQTMFKAAETIGGLPIIKGFRSNYGKAFRTPVSRSDEEMRLFAARLKNASPNVIEIHANRLTKALAGFKAKDRKKMFAQMNYRYAMGESYGVGVEKGTYFAEKMYEKGDEMERAFGAEIHKFLDELMPYYQNKYPIGETVLRVSNINKHMKEPFRANTATTQKGIEDADDLFHALMTKREKIVDEETGRNTWIDAPKNAKEISDPYELLWHVRIGLENTIAEEAFKDSINKTFGVRRGWSRNAKGNLIKRADEWHDGYNVTEKLGDHGWQTINELGDGYFFPPESANDIRNMLEMLKPEKKNVVGQYIDQVIRMWKATVTIYNPGYYTRNGVGEIMSSWLAGVNTLTPYNKARKLIKFAKREGGEMEELLHHYPLLKNQELGESAINGHEVAFTMKNGEKITYRKLWAAYNDQGLRSGFFNTDFRLQSGGIGSKMRATPGLRQLPQKHMALREWGERQENLFRSAHFIDVIMKHEGDFNSAILKARGDVVKYHFDYSDITNFEKTVMMRAFPFYKWTRKAAPLMMANLFTNPGKMTLYPKVANAISNTLSSDDFVDDNNGYAPNFTGMAPAWVTNLMGYQMGEADEEGNFTAGRLATPQMDALSAVFNPLSAGYTLSNPFVKAGVEQASGRTFGGDALAGATGFNSDLNDPRYEGAAFDESDTRLKHLARMTPQGNFAQKGFGQKAGGDEEQISWQDALGFATGLGVYDVVTPKPWVDYESQDKSRDLSYLYENR